jgi:hypothetical protein
MKFHAATFKSGGTSFGIFYPTGYVLSVFQSPADAERAVAALRAAGFADDDVVLSSGPELVEYSHELRDDSRLLIRIERFFSHRYGDESIEEDDLVELAEEGSAFIVTYCPDSAATRRATETARAFAPLVHRKFDGLTHRDLPRG